MKRLLVVVDMQNDFVNGSLKAEGGEEAAVAVRALVGRERERNTEIVYTKDLHGDNYLETQEGKRLPIPHCIRGTKGAELADGIYIAGAKIFEKDAFASVALGEYARDGKYDEILFAGICTDICVVSNALLVKAYCPTARVAVSASACAGTTKENHLSALNVMKCCQIDIE
ncbi:MAG: cysteine hydrolase [Clostridia bacterium]|nr:cysteine hydrolase [Clostridia bacterium]